MNLESSIFLTALALVTAGCSMAWLPLGPIVLGALLLTGLVCVRLHRPKLIPPPVIEDEE